MTAAEQPTATPSRGAMTVSELRAFVGPKADYYLKQADLRESLVGKLASVNPYALVFSYSWLAYRGLTKWMFQVAALNIVASLALQLVAVGVFGASEVPSLSKLAVTLGIGLWCGTQGNRRYIAFAEREVHSVRQMAIPEEEQLREIAKRGGGSWQRAIGWTLLYIVVETRWKSLQ